MLAATQLLRPGSARIGSLSKNITLPRAVQVSHVLGVLAGAIPGLLIGVPLAGLFGGLTTVALCMALGGGVGYLAVTWSPWQRESLATFAVVSAQSRSGRVDMRCPGSGERSLIGEDDDVGIGEGRCPSCGRRDKIDHDGNIAIHDIRRRVWIGVCPLPRVAMGETRVVGAAVPVVPGTVNRFGGPAEPRIDALALWRTRTPA
jgi:hypothetical protein